MNRNYCIAVDFDGTLCENVWPEIGPVKTDIMEIIKQLQSEGFQIVLWTCRTDDKLNAAVDFCTEHGLIILVANDNPKYLQGLYNNNPRKLGADMFIDDRNCGGLKTASEIYTNVHIDYAKCIEHGREPLIT